MRTRGHDRHIFRRRDRRGRSGRRVGSYVRERLFPEYFCKKMHRRRVHG